LNSGIVGALRRGGGGAATPGALPTLLGLANMLAAPICEPSAAFGRLPPIAAPPPPRPPPPLANEAAGVAKTMNNAIATFTEVFDMGKLRSFKIAPRMRGVRNPPTPLNSVRYEGHFDENLLRERRRYRSPTWMPGTRPGMTRGARISPYKWVHPDEERVRTASFSNRGKCPWSCGRAPRSLG
jgi:hypothetical protein